MIPPGRDWEAGAGASAAALAELRAAAPAGLPESYFQLLAAHDGGQGPLPVDPLWFMLYGVDDVLETWREAARDPRTPDLVQFASNGAGEAIAFDLASPGPAVVHFDAIDPKGTLTPLAPSLEALLEMVGLEDQAEGEARP